MKRSKALILAAHGSQLSADASAPTHAHAERIRLSGIFDEVLAAFWKEGPPLRDALSLVRSDDVYVVPMFLAEGYFTRGVVPRELGLERWRSENPGRTVHYCPPVGTHPSMERLVLDRAYEAVPLSPAERRGAALVVIGHGTDRSDTSGQTVYRLLERLRERDDFDHFDCGFLDEEPRIEAVIDRTPATNIVLVPFFMAEGWHTRSTIPEDLRLSGPRTDRDGKTLWYSRPVGTMPELAETIIDIAEQAVADA